MDLASHSTPKPLSEMRIAQILMISRAVSTLIKSRQAQQVTPDFPEGLFIHSRYIRVERSERILRHQTYPMDVFENCS